MTNNIRLNGFSWGWRIALLYGGFVALIMTLVIRSSHQHFDLVSKDYYEKEIAYQQVIDASRNQSALSSAMEVHANATNVVIEMPAEFAGKSVIGSVQFYSPVNAAWDKKYPIRLVDNKIMIARSELKNTRYTIKIDCEAAGKKYYQETELNLY